MRYLWAIAAILITVLGVGQVEHKVRDWGVHQTSRRLNRSRTYMNEAATQLRVYKKTHGHYPSDKEGIIAISDLLEARKNKSSDWDISIIRIAPSGIVTDWGDPLIYENRRGKPASAYAESGVEKYAHGNYSLKVDDDIYLWSVAAQQHYQALSRQRLLIGFGYTIVLVPAVFCFTCFIIVRRRHLTPSGLKTGTTKSVLWCLGGFALAFITGLMSPEFLATCYRMSVQDRRDPDLTQDYISVMRKYRDNGAISKSAYDKLITALDADDKSPYR